MVQDIKVTKMANGTRKHTYICFGYMTLCHKLSLCCMPRKWVHLGSKLLKLMCSCTKHSNQYCPSPTILCVEVQKAKTSILHLPFRLLFICNMKVRIRNEAKNHFFAASIFKFRQEAEERGNYAIMVWMKINSMMNLGFVFNPGNTINLRFKEKKS